MQPLLPPPPVPIRPSTDVPTLAGVVTWSQEFATRHSAADLVIVLALARYSGVIEGDLEATLAKIGKTVAPQSSSARAGVGDLLLALRQVEALLANNPIATDASGFSRRVG